jgi:hypothetical protein
MDEPTAAVTAAGKRRTRAFGHLDLGAAAATYRPDDGLMENLQDFAPVAVVILKALVLLALPVVCINLIWSGLRRLAPQGFFAMPLLYTVARFTGVGLGLILIFVHQDSRNFDLHEIFGPDGPWNISFTEFLLVRINPLQYGPIAFIGKFGEARGLPLLGVATLTAILLLSIGWAWKTWKPRLAARATLSMVIIVLSMAYLTIYGVSLLFWILFLFNSWTFLLLAILLQYYRNRH